MLLQSSDQMEEGAWVNWTENRKTMHTLNLLSLFNQMSGMNPKGLKRSPNLAKV